jgi:hypothetical protein
MRLACSGTITRRSELADAGTGSGVWSVFVPLS